MEEKPEPVKAVAQAVAEEKIAAVEAAAKTVVEEKAVVAEEEAKAAKGLTAATWAAEAEEVIRADATDTVGPHSPRALPSTCKRSRPGRYVPDVQATAQRRSRATPAVNKPTKKKVSAVKPAAKPAAGSGSQQRQPAASSGRAASSGSRQLSRRSRQWSQGSGKRTK